MAKFEEIEVEKLLLDLNNFRNVKQSNEEGAIKAMIHISPDSFWALTNSILTDGFLNTENIIVLKTPFKKEVKLVAMEGNRRVAILKMIHGMVALDSFPIPDDLREGLKSVPAAMKKACLKVPCQVYEFSEKATVDRIINLTHGKSEKAGRDHWSPVARARHNRDAKSGTEIGLDLLEKYLVNGQNISAIQKERWAGDFPLSILDTAVNRLAPRLGCAKSAELSANYPKIKYRNELEDIILAIGLTFVKTEHVREADFGLAYGIPLLPVAGGSAPATGTSVANTTGNTTAGNTSGTTASGNGTVATTTTQPSAPKKAKAKGKIAGRAFAINDPRAVTKKLKQFIPVGNNREKIVTLRDEALRLNIGKNTLSFCFLLRSMFEISAKIYCKENNIPTQRPRSKKDPTLVDKTLAQTLIAVSDFLTKGQKNSPMEKVLLAAKSELTQPDRLLSVTSMNQLVHNPVFVITGSDIAILFAKVYPLLEAMN